MKFLHLSDLHIHRDMAKNRAVAALFAGIAKKYPGHYLIITGDITDDGFEEQYANALTMLQPFLGRVFIVPGNHDFGAAGNFYFREKALLFDNVLCKNLRQGGVFTGEQKPLVNVVSDGTDQVMLIGLDSNLETYVPFDFACGEIGAYQLKALESILNSAPRQMTKILFLHHHPFIHNNPFMELQDAKELFRVIYGRVDVLLFGHKHVEHAWQNCSGIKHILAANDSPGKKYVKEITIQAGTIVVNMVPVPIKSV